MSSGKVHTRACLFLAAGFLAGSLITQDMGDLEYVGGALTGILVSPDCDVDSKFIAYKYIRQRLGMMAEQSWSAVWYFYRRSIKHGSELSHFPVISTLGRVAYLFLFAIIIPYLFLDIFLPVDWGYELNWWMAYFAKHYKWILGLMGADIIHFTLDVLTTEHQSTRKSNFRRVAKRRKIKSGIMERILPTEPS